MTVAVGAICDGGKAVVVAADTLVTFPQLNLHIEGAISKIAMLTPHVVGVLTGAISDGHEILSMARPRIESLGSNPSIDKIVEAIRQAYEDFKIQRVERTMLRPYLGINFETFRHMASTATQTSVLQQLAIEIVKHTVGVDIFIAGMSDGAAHIFGVGNPGETFRYDIYGCAALGVGMSYSIGRFAIAQHSITDTLSTALYTTYEAKKSAEAAPGVGKLTQMKVITSAGIKDMPQQLFDRLDEIHSRKPVLSPADITAIQTAYAST
jgi:20S proteasome alpha/beta subunit